MTLDLTTYRAHALSHAQGLGLFEQVLGHEPVSAPGSGLTYALWVKGIRPIPARSGLDAVTARLELTGRVFLPADTQPEDDVDVAVTGAVDGLMAAYSSDFQLGGTVANVDLLGAHGPGLGADFGYARFDSTTYRVATLTVPLIINDAWTEAP
ncbi:hypothetical protein EASAB2608_06193 [Streptomyces sp. EAS-AB2608]|uniref:hypothetical protein n=1 Tax=Streptomyces sp. EAS-AB2608 TaxID=2779671 RepID=UPI001BF042A3|nr:hypothetical protein [Streptomyces sp. EAS-AB2608]BCM70859.1 hypothetical protein EASAB2608_06193 [Streptomyces sp. EAS-AB2608]